MLSKNQLKFINRLKKKKIRQQHGLFIAEGIKVVEEILRSKYILHTLYCTSDYSNSLYDEKIQSITETELNSISEFSSPNKVLALFEIPKNKKMIHPGLH